MKLFNFIKRNSEQVVAPISGKCISITRVNDQVFSSKSLGDGFAIIPNDCMVVSPVDGKITLIAETKHAFGVKTEKGVEILVHIGLDTVQLEGRGFAVHVKQGEKVKAGDQVISFEKAYVEDSSIDMTTMTVFTSGMTEEVRLGYYEKQVTQGDILISKI